MKDACDQGCTESQRAEYKRAFKLELHDLNRDKSLEAFVYIDHRDWCGMGFNCHFWVFQRQRRGYKLLARAEVLRVGKTISNGYRDLESQGRMGGCVLPEGGWGRHIYLTLFKYDGAKYQPTVIGEQCRTR